MVGLLLSARSVWPMGWLVGLCALAGGCRAEGEPLVPVAGRVTLKGKPVSEGSISFRPDATRANATLHHPTGRIEADGTYRLFIREREGAPPGWYKVVLFINEPLVHVPGQAHPGMPKSLIDRRYNRPDTTPWSIEVRLDAPPESYDFDLP